MPAQRLAGERHARTFHTVSSGLHMSNPDSPPSFTYIIHATEPAPSNLELDDSSRDAIELVVTWRDTILFHDSLDPLRAFFLGSPASSPRRSWKAQLPAHYLLPIEVLGCSSVRLLAHTVDGPAVLLDGLPAATSVASESGETSRSEFARWCASQGWYDARLASHYWPLQSGALSLKLGAFGIDCRRTSAARPLPRALVSHLSSESATYLALSFASTAAILTSAAFFTPPLGVLAEEGINRDDLILMQQYLDAAAEREREPKRVEGESTAAQASGETGERTQGSEGAMGSTATTNTNRRYAVKGPPDNPDPHLARERLLQEASVFGAIGLLSAVSTDPNTPLTPWGRDDVLGRDAQSALGNLWAEDLGEAAGTGGLSLLGSGSGGGVIGQGIGLGDIGTFNRGMGPGGTYNFGSDHGRLTGSRASRPSFRMRAATPTVSGRLPPQVIQRIVRQNHGRFRLCYEKGLGANPSLSGRVSVRFVIGRNGAVSNVANAGATLASSDVVSCVVRAFYGLSFPQPEGGLVTVTYPLAFTPE